MTDNFEKDINVPSKEIIIKFSDGYCIVLENNEVSIRENVFTKFRIVFGKRTNELLEFVKELYLNKKAKEQECEELHSRTASIIYNLTGGRLSYSTYTLEGCADAYQDQLKMDVERATKDLEEENETLKQEVNTLEQALDEIEELAKALSNRTPLFESEQIAKDIIKIKNTINKVKEQ